MTKQKKPDWSALSPQKCEALLHLDFAVPMHPYYLTRRLKVRSQTLRALIGAGLVRTEFYAETKRTSKAIGVPFVTLTQAGLELRRDYVNWHKRLLAKLGSLPPELQRVVDLA